MRLIKAKLAFPAGDYLIATQCVADGSGQWQRKLINVTPNQLSVGLDRSFERGGFKLTVDDVDETFRTMMANDTYRKIYGSTITLYVYAQDGATLADTITASVSDWDRNEGHFILDCVQEFAAKMAKPPSTRSLKFNATSWPNAPGTTIGQAVPMPEGTQNATGGAVTAYLVDVIGDIWVDWTTCRYVYVHTWSNPGGAARCSDVTNVYVEGVEQVEDAGAGPSTWTHSRDANGWELIVIAPPPPRPGLLECAPAYVTVNGVYGTESSASQNPVGVLDTILTAAGLDLVDGSGTDFYDYCATNSWKHSGNTPENIATIKEYMETWAHDFDAWWRLSSDGKIHIKHVDWSSVTADATMTASHFMAFKEKASTSQFTNRIQASFNYNAAQSEWLNLVTVDSTTGDYLPASMPVEAEDEYVMFSYIVGAAHPVTGAIRYLDRPIYTVGATVDLFHYEQFGLGLLKIVTATHYNQIGASGKYIIIDEAKDYIAGTVAIRMIRLWGA